MATYIQGVTDYIPKIQPFKPDLNFYNTVLATKQTRYDAAMKQIGNLYGTLLYSPLTGEDNKKRRDDYFKMIEQDLKKISSMDLSLPQNQSIAETVFDPLINDKAITHDMAWTRHALDSKDAAGSYKAYSGNDPDKDMGGTYWEQGDLYIDLKMQEYAKASQSERYTMSAPDFHPQVNLLDKAFKWADDRKIVVEAVSDQGDYLITRQNGKQMRVPLQSIYSSLYGNDPKVKAMYDVEAYLDRKTYIDRRKDEFNGDEMRAEEEWFNDVMRTTGLKLLEKQKMAEGQVAYAKFAKDYMARKIQLEGISKRYGKEDPRYLDMVAAMEDEMLAQLTSDYYKDVMGEMENMNSSYENRKMMRGKIDRIVSAGKLEQAITSIATRYAETHDAVTKIEVDQFALEYKKHLYNMAETKYSTDLDYQKQLKLKIFDMTKDMYTFMKAGAGNNMGTPLTADADQMANDLNAFYNYSELNTQGQSMQNMSENSYVDMIVQKADALLNNPNSTAAEIMTAKQMKKNIFGQHYDMSTNRYLKNGQVYDNWKNANFQAATTNKFFTSAVNVFQQNSGSFTPNEVNKLTEISDNQAKYWAQKAASRIVLDQNSNAIFQAIDASAQITNKNAFKRLFKKNENGQYVLRNETDFTRTYVEALRNQGSTKSEAELNKIATAEYVKQFGLYSMMYNNGVPGMRTYDGSIMGPNGMLNRGSIGKMMYGVDPSSPFSDGTMALMSLKNDMLVYDPTGTVKNNWLMITNSGVLTKEEFDELKSDDPEQVRAQRLAMQFLEDQGKAYTTDGDKKLMPRGTMTYKPTAVNSSNIEAYVITPSYDWLKSYEDSKTKLVWGKSVDDWIQQGGITIYRDKRTSNTMLTKEFEAHPFDALVKSGARIDISKPNGGNMSMQYKFENGTPVVEMSGYVNQYDNLPNGEVVVRRIPVNQSIDASTPGFSPGKLYAGTREKFDLLEIMNYNIKFNNADYGDLMTDQASLDNFISSAVNNALIRQDLKDKSYPQRVAEGISQTFQQQMSIVENVMQSIGK